MQEISRVRRGLSYDGSLMFGAAVFLGLACGIFGARSCADLESRSSKDLDGWRKILGTRSCVDLGGVRGILGADLVKILTASSRSWALDLTRIFGSRSCVDLGASGKAFKILGVQDLVDLWRGIFGTRSCADIGGVRGIFGARLAAVRISGAIK